MRVQILPLAVATIHVALVSVLGTSAAKSATQIDLAKHDIVSFCRYHEDTGTALWSYLHTHTLRSHTNAALRRGWGVEAPVLISASPARRS